MFLLTVPVQGLPNPIVIFTIFTLIIVLYWLTKYGYRPRFPKFFSSVTNVNEQIEIWTDDLSQLIFDLYKLKDADDSVIQCLFTKSHFRTIKSKLNAFFNLYEQLFLSDSEHLLQTDDTDEILQFLKDQLNIIYDHSNSNADHLTKKRNIFKFVFFLCENFCDFKSVNHLYDRVYFDGIIRYHQSKLKLPKSNLSIVENSQSVYNNKLLAFLSEESYESLRVIDTENSLVNENDMLFKFEKIKLTGFMKQAFNQFFVSLDRISSEHELSSESNSQNAAILLSMFNTSKEKIQQYKHTSYVNMYAFVESNFILDQYLDSFDHTKELINIERSFYNLIGQGGKGLIMYEENIAHTLMKNIHLFVLATIYNTNINDIQTIYKHRRTIIDKNYVRAIHSLNRMQVNLAIDFPRLFMYSNLQVKNFQLDKFIMYKLQFKQLYEDIMKYITAFDFKNVFSSDDLTFHNTINNPLLNMVIQLINMLRNTLNSIINDPSGYIKSAFATV